MQQITQPISDVRVHDYRVRNYTHEAIDKGELSCLVQFIASLDVCKVCVREIPKIQSSFGSELDFSIDFDAKTLDIRYGRRSPVSVW